MRLLNNKDKALMSMLLKGESGIFLEWIFFLLFTIVTTEINNKKKKK